MSKRVFFILALLGVFIFATACGGSAESTSTETAHDDDHGDDHGMDHEHVDPPHDFEALTNPVSLDSDAIAAGKTLFETNCAACHGIEGMGDGAAAAGLDPKPATLADGMMMDMLSDGYLYWRVSKGGAMEPFNSAMPAWETALTEEQRWQVISYVRTLAEGEHGDKAHDDGHSDDHGDDHGDDNHD